MVEFLLLHEPVTRLSVFLAVLGLMALWEIWTPRRRIEVPRVLRWSNNLALVVVDAIALRLVFPVVAVGLAVVVQERGWGLFNLLNWPLWLEITIGVVVLDFAIYLQHVTFHHVPFLWRLHRMHHTDTEIDVTTGLRFHPLEILLSMAFKLILVVILGPAAIAVLIFEVVLNASAMFNHSNISLPKRVDAFLRLVIVTPDMHRVHHSVDPVETNSNYGFNVPWWDRLLGTYIAQPRAGHDEMDIGLHQFRTQRDLWLDRMILQPFRRDTAQNKRSKK
ncbi:sterol desaturase/sphingolipid hydroxylase (fatty acid hydroxylase superfamily) [Pacificibacter maritimus]|uniref:Sterol desaturase/sphingolipid hydroxylase (Fatty acid hydroxylase superfamily) n=1 Tax=Pacificibacter maritimus TaxID=762213 RepID=A0A3N4U696_9RHOB|nr:sterol desaturase family protein [Pacificibacter maritimus]RPE66313.1 sterol desaturase/sphingolipid hydroxylase (fatty acid hydroxylase superfamily) [Pacificibacter maritimus]